MVRIKPIMLGAAAALLPSTLALPRHNIENINIRRGPDGVGSNVDRAQAVIEAFRFSWEGYYKYAFPHDELHPVTNTFSDSRNAWGASAVDALSTALIMGQRDIVNQIISYVPTINFTTTATEVSLFETTIRYLGGLVSGYDFLSGPLAHLADDKKNVDALLTQAQNLANTLSYAFDTPTGIPHNTLFLSTRSTDTDPNGLATTGTLVMEWTRLADLTGNKTYADLVQKAESYLLTPKPASNEPFPGLVGTNISPETGLFLDASGGWTGGTDSFYEYLIKMYIYSPAQFAQYRDRWILAADSTIQYLTSHPVTRPDLTFVAMYRNTTLRLVSQHLACFDGGNFILGGQVLGNQSYIDYGLELVEGCRQTYQATATGIGPEIFAWDEAEVPDDQGSFFNRSGFYITNPTYDLRPEVLESYYYAYRATGDIKYKDWAWEAFVHINETARVGSGFSSVDDVNVVGGSGHGDFMESFWFAEVLKYAYLIQTAGDEEWQVDGKGDGWVFNTEAHPFRVRSS
ncbi:mannosyl-oligosaccharide alpha-1,2-mannosidase-like protein [Delitschia confertaspora ATCC 74209]|uniref:alpha-1,2-Mannosidase n=1 Tax=Delitschia confertaspora ATCC 74209 TaxID=1513339 RepID=A0A9P4JP78_9PLEO|nr:mannosyl-oligosaccharide alpha-1,2-mannosidase-like protein [Delitschia confertaspora ATCC 74209]